MMSALPRIILQRPGSSATQATTSSAESKTMAALHDVFGARVGNSSAGVLSDSKDTCSGGGSNVKHLPVASPKNSNLLGNMNTTNANMKKKNERVPVICSNDAQISASKNQLGRCCPVCKLKVPMPQQSYIDHIMGKKHRIAEYKQKLTKKQKEDRDARTLHVTGFHNKTVPEEICGAFWNLGMVDYFTGTNHVFVEFGSRSQALIAASTKVCLKNGKKLTTAFRTPRHHVSDVVAEEPVQFTLSRVVSNLLTMVPTSSEQLQETLERLLNDVQMRPDEYENRQYVRKRIGEFLRLEFPNVTCHVFGSSANNLGFRGADVDLYAALGYDPYDTPRAADGEQAAARLTYYLAKHLRRQHWISSVEAIPKARVPIIKFVQAGVAVDLSFRNGMPIQNTALIHLYTLVHPLVRPYMLVVRFWAKMQGMAGGGKPNTLITNYALTMLMAFVLMVKRDMLPTVTELRKQPYTQVIINGWNCGFGENVFRHSSKEHDCSYLQLALEFFEYYASLDMSSVVLCPLVGQLVPRQHFASKSLAKLPTGLQDYVNAPSNLQYDKPFCVQDPFDLSHNVTRGLGKIPLERFQLLCKKSAEVLTKIMKLELPLAALFQQIELTDDMYDEQDDADDGSHGQANGDDTMKDEVIMLDDDADTSQDIEILEEVKHVLRKYEEIRLENDESAATNGSSKKGTKRSSTEAQACVAVTSHGNACNDGNVTSSHEVHPSEVITVPEMFFCSRAKKDDPTLYRLCIPLRVVYELNTDTGDVSECSYTHSIDTVKQLGINILQFMFEKVYAAEVQKTEISSQATTKRLKVSSASGKPNNCCIAKFQVTCNYELSDGKTALHTINSDNGSNEQSPFGFERKITELQLESISKGEDTYGRAIEPLLMRFFVCYNENVKHEVLLIANTIKLTPQQLSALTGFCNGFRLLTDRCLSNALLFLNKTKMEGAKTKKEREEARAAAYAARTAADTSDACLAADISAGTAADTSAACTAAANSAADASVVVIID